MYPMFKFDGNLTDPETGADQFVRVNVEIPADTNYPPGTQLMNLHDYKMIMPIASGTVSGLSQGRLGPLEDRPSQRIDQKRLILKPKKRQKLFVLF